MFREGSVKLFLLMLAMVSLFGRWPNHAAEASSWSVHFLDSDADRVYYYRDVAPDELKFQVSGLPPNMSLIARFGYLDGVAFVPTNVITNSYFTSHVFSSGDTYTFHVFVQQSSGDNQHQPVAFEVGYISGGVYHPLGSMPLSDGISNVYVNIKPPASFLGEYSLTTDFVPDPLNFGAISGLAFHRPGKSMIQFDGTVNILADVDKLSVLDVYTDMAQTGKAGLDTELFQSLAGRFATVTMYELPFTSMPDIFVYDGGHNRIDGSGIVSNKSYVIPTGELSFNVSHFTTFEAAVLAQLQVAPNSKTIGVGETAELAVTGVFSNGESLPVSDVAWVSGDNAVATVDGAGRVTGTAAGTCTIAASKSGVTGSATITVTFPEQTPALIGLTLSPEFAAVMVNSTVRFSVTGVYDDGSAIPVNDAIWSSSNPAVAFVDATGLVSGLAPGVCTIRVNYGGLESDVPLTVVRNREENREHHRGNMNVNQKKEFPFFEYMDWPDKDWPFNLRFAHGEKCHN